MAPARNTYLRQCTSYQLGLACLLVLAQVLHQLSLSHALASDLSCLSVESTMSSEIAGGLASSDWGDGINPCLEWTDFSNSDRGLHHISDTTVYRIEVGPLINMTRGLLFRRYPLPLRTSIDIDLGQMKGFSGPLPDGTGVLCEVHNKLYDMRRRPWYVGVVRQAQVNLGYSYFGTLSSFLEVPLGYSVGASFLAATGAVSSANRAVESCGAVLGVPGNLSRSESNSSLSGNFDGVQLQAIERHCVVACKMAVGSILQVPAQKSWLYDIFISHAGSLKELARDLENDLRDIGWKVFVDIHALQPGDLADQSMLEAARSAPIGLVLFDGHFISRKWPMCELKVILESDSLLPVVVGMPFKAFEASLLASPLASLLDKSLLEKLVRTSFVVDKGGWQGELRQKICFAVTRFFVEKVVPRLPDTRRSMLYILRASEAAKAFRNKRFPDLSGRDYEEAEKWIQQLEGYRDQAWTT